MRKGWGFKGVLRIAGGIYVRIGGSGGRRMLGKLKKMIFVPRRGVVWGSFVL